MFLPPIHGKLKNGLRYILNNNECSNTVTVLFMVKVGSRNEIAGYKGISHFLEHMLFKGTEKRPTAKDIGDDVYKYGGKFNAFTDYDHTGYYVKIDKKHIDMALDVLSDMLFHSKFDANEIKTEKYVVINENERADSEPNKRIDMEISHMVFKDTTLEVDVGGFNDQIEKFNRNMTVAYFLAFYKPSNIVLSIAGNIGDYTKLKKKLEMYFDHRMKMKSKIKYKETKTKLYPKFMEIQKRERYENLVLKNYTQTYVSVAFPSYKLNTFDAYVMEFIGTLLAGNMSSRLFIQMREREGLVYNVKQYYEQFEDFGALKIFFSTFNDKKKIKRCYEIVINELEDLRTNSLKKKELEETREYLIGNLILGTEDSKNIATFYGENMIILNKPLSYRHVIDQYKRITAKDVMRVANNVFKGNKFNMAILGEKDLSKKNLNHT